MLKSLIPISKKKLCCKQFSNRNVKVFKFIPTPAKASSRESSQPRPTEINKNILNQLERISLVGFESPRGCQILEDAIRFADQILQVNTDEVKPLVTVLEDESLHLREDIPHLDTTRSDLLSHSKVVEENYFVTPTGNKEYIPKEDIINLKPSVAENICQN